MLKPDNEPSVSVAAGVVTLVVWTVVALAIGSWPIVVDREPRTDATPRART